MTPRDPGAAPEIEDPPGDPEGLRLLALGWLRAGAAVRAELLRVVHGAETLAGSWAGVAGAAFLHAVGELRRAVDAVADGLDAGGRVLNRYAAALVEARDEVRRLRAQLVAAYEQAEAELIRESVTIAAGGQPAAVDPRAVLADERAAVDLRLAAARERLQSDLDAAVRALGDIVTNGPTALALATVLVRGRDMVAVAWNSWPVALQQGWSEIKGSAALSGRLATYGWAAAALARESTPAGLAAARQAAEHARLEVGLEVFGDQSLSGMVKKVVLPLAVAGDVRTLVEPGDPGAHGVATRIAAGVDLAGLTGVGVLTLTGISCPPLAAAAGIALAAGTAYSVGNYLYNHRATIARDVRAAGRWAGRGVQSGLGWLGRRVHRLAHPPRTLRALVGLS